MIVSELLQLSGSYWSTCALHAGVKLDVFTLLVEAPMTVPELAQIINANQRGLGMLLNALTALELLEKKGECFSATVFSGEHLSRKSPAYMGHIIMHHHYLMEGWSKLDEAVQYGTPVRTRSSHGTDRAQRESFLMGMFNLASMLAPRLAEEINLSGRHRLLDLAGGPGTYAIHFCKKNPELNAVIYDLPTTRPFAEQTVERFALSDRIVFMEGDIIDDPIGSGFDVVWISHLLHSEGPETCAAIVAKAVAALDDGGLLLIQEFILDDSRTAPLQPALFSLNMLIGTPSGQAYSQTELRDMMTKAGSQDVQLLPIQLPNGAGIMTGVR
jgi:hypothetical protein